MQIVTLRARFLFDWPMHHPPLKRLAVMTGEAEAVVQPNRLAPRRASGVAGLTLTLGKRRVILGKQEFLPGTTMGIVTAMTAILPWRDALMLGCQLVRLHGVTAKTEGAHCFFE